MEKNYQRILIALDGSDGADKAFHKAIGMAKRNNATLILAHVVDTRVISPVANYDNEYVNLAKIQGEKILENYEKKAQDADFTNVKLLLKRGMPKVVLTKEIIPDEDIDLIVMGATGVNAVERFLIGSVTESIMRHAQCDVLIVK
ncbi:MAG TPA: universal stress protein [Pseudogracilibacillus sp.]|nr:universal stress protein [Pseudogracilibacillus sp.]